MKIKRSLAFRIYAISKNLGIPRVTVETVIKEYLRSLEISALNGEDIVIDNIMSIKLYEKEGDVIPRGRVSPTLKVKLLNCEGLSKGIDYEQELKLKIGT